MNSHPVPSTNTLEKEIRGSGRQARSGDPATGARDTVAFDGCVAAQRPHTRMCCYGESRGYGLPYWRGLGSLPAPLARVGHSRSPASRRRRAISRKQKNLEIENTISRNRVQYKNNTKLQNHKFLEIQNDF